DLALVELAGPGGGGDHAGALVLLQIGAFHEKADGLVAHGQHPGRRRSVDLGAFLDLDLDDLGVLVAARVHAHASLQSSADWAETRGRVKRSGARPAVSAVSRRARKLQSRRKGGPATGAPPEGRRSRETRDVED